MSSNRKIDNSPIRSKEKSTTDGYLIFTLGDEKYGIEILKVQEICGYEAVMQIADTPDFIKGIVNMRGKIVPIVDLRIKFQLTKVEYVEFNVVIILNLNGRAVGILVDGILDIKAVKDEQIRDFQSVASNIDPKYIFGIASAEAHLVIMVDIEQLMSSQEMALIDSVNLH